MDGNALFESLNPLQMVLVALAAFSGSVTAGLSGMGGGMLLAVVVSPIVGIHALIPVMTITILFNHIARVSAFRREVNWRIARRVMVSALPLTVLGASVYAVLPARAVAIVLGLFVLIFVPARRLLGDSAWQLSPAGLTGVGGLFGFISGTAFGAGMILIPVLLGMGLSGAALVGTDAVIGLGILITKALTFSTLSVLSTDRVVFGAVIGLFTMPGVYLARWIIKRTSVRVHTAIIELVLILGGASFVWRGVFSD
jgi:uncharacterized protein